MFGLDKKTKIADNVGEYLFREIKWSFDRNEDTTSIKLLDPTSIAYIRAFLIAALHSHDINFEKHGDKLFKRICNKILPNKLYQAALRQFTAFELAGSMDKKTEDASEFIVKFFRGYDPGKLEGALFHVNTSSPSWLRAYLCDELAEDILDEED